MHFVTNPKISDRRENNLIALNLNFQYIFCLKKSRWAATKKQMITIPINSTDILDTTNQLPRLPADAGLIPVGLKRKTTYKHCHKKEYVDPRKIFSALRFLKEKKHPSYLFYDEFDDYERRCEEDDPVGHRLIFVYEDGIEKIVDIDEYLKKLIKIQPTW